MADIEGIIKRIKERRIALNLSYQDVADITGLSKSTIQRYETGAIRKLPVNQIEDIAKALHVSPGYLMGWDSFVADEPPRTEKELLIYFRRLNEDGQTKVLDYVHDMAGLPQYLEKNVISV